MYTRYAPKNKRKETLKLGSKVAPRSQEKSRESVRSINHNIDGPAIHCSQLRMIVHLSIDALTLLRKSRNCLPVYVSV